MFCKSLLPSLLVLGAIVAIADGPAFAQKVQPTTSGSSVQKPVTEELELVPTPDTTVIYSNIPALFNRALYNETGRFYDYTTILGQLNTMFGWRTGPEGSYFDNMIVRDAKLTETLYYGVMQAQQAGPLMRSADLPNPFDTSLQENPSYLSPGGF